VSIEAGAVPPLTTASQAAGNPRHLAVILDGNRRWARLRGVPIDHAYRQGAGRVTELAVACHARDIRCLTVWALSQENLVRPAAELEPLLAAVISGLREIAASGHWQIRHLGDSAMLPPATRGALREIIESTRPCAPGVMNIALAYSGRQDIVAAVRDMVTEWRLDSATASTIDAGQLADKLCRHLATVGLPDPDLVIRTSGERRLSGFMLWEAAFAELYFTSVEWPDFSAVELDQALASFRARDRRYGV
jgi:short-chain Z-isoprenyl diphosphate synthase